MRAERTGRLPLGRRRRARHRLARAAGAWRKRIVRTGRW